MIFYIAEGYQSCPRSTWNQLMRLGYARTRYSGACFQGLISSDVDRFSTGREQLYMDSERDAKSIISDDDSDYPDHGLEEKFLPSSNRRQEAMTAYQNYKMDRENIRRYMAQENRETSKRETLPTAISIELSLLGRKKPQWKMRQMTAEPATRHQTT